MSEILYFAEVKQEQFKEIVNNLNKIIKDKFPDGVKIYEIDGNCIGKALKVDSIGEYYNDSLTADFEDNADCGNSIRVYHPGYISYLILVNDELLLHIKANPEAK